MSISKRKILLKLSGTILVDQTTGKPSITLLKSLIDQIITLHASHQFALVIGGGNIFRGQKHGKDLQLRASTAHQIGMLATVCNGLVIQDICTQKALDCQLFCAIEVPSIAQNITVAALDAALAAHHLVIFTGGTGNPFFTTDTCAVVRALQIDAHEVWKATNVDGVYTSDPEHNPTAKKITRLLYTDALAQQLAIMDSAAYALANTHKLPIRIFDVFAPNALLNAAHNENFGSILLSEDIHHESRN